MPLVSIVIPCYKGTKYLRQAIESCLRQTHRELEVIVVDDASPQDDAEIAEAYVRADPRVRLIRRPVNGGVSRAFNAGFADARGRYFTRLAQDDLFDDDALEIMVSHLESRPDCGLVYCDMKRIDGEGRVIGFEKTEEPDRALLPVARAGLCVMWRRDVWEAVGPFDPRYDTAEDYEFMLRVSRQFKLEKRRDCAPFFFRYHPDQGGKVFELRQNLTFTTSQFAHQWELVKRRPWDMTRWKSLVGCRVRIWNRRLRLALSRPDGYAKADA